MSPDPRDLLPQPPWKGLPLPRVMLAERRWNQILQYIHYLPDLEKFSAGRGTVRLYHGAPSQFAGALVTSGPRVPYAVYALARKVASIYGLNWSQFQEYAYRKHEVVEKLSTATAPIACRWAWSFPKGEILTDLNSHAMMLVAANSLARSRGISVSIAYEELYNRAIEIARLKGRRVTSDSAPYILGLQDRLELRTTTGSLVEIIADASATMSHGLGQHDPTYFLEGVRSGELSEEEALIFWNHEYRDFRIDPKAIISSRIVIHGMEYWEQDVIEDMIKRGELSLLPHAYRRVR